VSHLIVTAKMVDDPAGELDHLLAHPDDPAREAAFRQRLSEERDWLKKGFCEKIPEWQKSYGLNFSDRRIMLIIKHAMDRQTDVEIMVGEFQAIANATTDYARQFSLRNDMDVLFADEAIDYLAEKIWSEPQDLTAYLKRLL
jgi:hypothetical protein